MTTIKTGKNVGTKTIRVIPVGKEAKNVEVPINCKGSDILAKYGGAGKKVSSRGTDVVADTPVEEGQSFYVGPVSVKQGL